MKKRTKAAMAVSAAAAVYGVAAYGATKALMDVAMKRDLPQHLHGKGSHLTGEREDEGYRAAQREAAQKARTSHTETVLLRSREGAHACGAPAQMRKRRTHPHSLSRLALGVVSGFRAPFGVLGGGKVQCALCGAARTERERGGLYRLWPHGALRLPRLGALGRGPLRQ